MKNKKNKKNKEFAEKKLIFSMFLPTALAVTQSILKTYFEKRGRIVDKSVAGFLGISKVECENYRCQLEKR